MTALASINTWNSSDDLIQSISFTRLMSHQELVLQASLLASAEDSQPQKPVQSSTERADSRTPKSMNLRPVSNVTSECQETEATSSNITDLIYGATEIGHLMTKVEGSFGK